MITDPIADMLTRMRNASAAGHEQVNIPASRLKVEILKILKNERFINDYQIIRDGKKATVRVRLAFGRQKEKLITGMKRVSTPGCRMYVGKEEVPKVRGGIGVCILSTPGGVITDKEARKRNTGGEVLCYVW